MAFVSDSHSEAGQGGSIMLTTADAILNWTQGQSLWSFAMGTACCAMEFIAGSFSKFDADRLGVFPRADPRHTDVMVVAGTITEKMKPAVRRLYEQMPDPKWVVAMGNCTVSGGIFHYDSYSVVRGIDQFIPVDVYIAGCPPRPEALQDGLIQLRRLIRARSLDGSLDVSSLEIPRPEGASYSNEDPGSHGVHASSEGDD